MTQPGERWTIGKVCAWATEDFKARGLPSPRLEAEVLLGFVLQIPRIRIIVDGDRPLTDAELARYKALIVRRRRREPVAYLLGEREFYGRSFRVDGRVLVPRPDTEHLVEVALERTKRLSQSGRGLDLCTGSGCVVITLAKERPTWKWDASDLDAGALAVARENAQRLGAVWNVRLAEGDLFAPFAADDRWDLIVANPPYIPDGDIAALDADVRDFEPRLALAGGADGLDLVRRIIAEAPKHLRKGGVLCLEVMMGQPPVVADLMKESGFAAVSVRRDYGGIDRVVSGELASLERHAPGHRHGP